ncbi:MAG: amidohydrolase family protein [Gammaproteobacteria bacterium]
MREDWDVLLRGGLLFDGGGTAPFVEDLALADGRIAARGAGLDPARARRVYDAQGLWVMPGLLDIHTHLDLEVELAPGLEEVVRHGTTTVVFGNCSLGTAFGAQRRGDDDPILDCFARVENIPKEVLKRCVDVVTWQSTREYLEHLASLPLGPNVVPLIPHSMLRIEAMGVEQSISRAPTEAELQQMERLLARAMQEGYVGFSTDNIPFHYLANKPHTAAKIPSPYAAREEQKRLLDVVREHERVWQATPDTLDRFATFKRFLYTSGRLFGKPLRTTALTAIDLVHERKAWKTFLGLARFLNSPLMQGKFHFQVLGTPFKIWCVGPISPVFEEFSTTRPLLECELEDREGRRRILAQPAYIEQFERDWFDRKLVLTFQRNLDIMHIDDCPVGEWCGETMGQVYRRAESWRGGNRRAARSEAEAAAFARAAGSMRSHPAFFLHLLREFDRDIRFHFVVGNDRPEILEKLLFDEHTLPGFNDSGAHLINMAFFDGNLQTLRFAQQRSLARVAQAVKKLTRDPAEFFGIDAGSIEIGRQADVAVVDPAALSSYDTDRSRRLVYREVLQEKQLVNRSDGVVDAVFIAGTQVWARDRALPVLGTQALGRPLTFAGRSSS